MVQNIFRGIFGYFKQNVGMRDSWDAASFCSDRGFHRACVASMCIKVCFVPLSDP